MVQNQYIIYPYDIYLYWVMNFTGTFKPNYRRAANTLWVWRNLAPWHLAIVLYNTSFIPFHFSCIFSKTHFVPLRHFRQPMFPTVSCDIGSFHRNFCVWIYQPLLQCTVVHKDASSLRMTFRFGSLVHISQRKNMQTTFFVFDDFKTKRARSKILFNYFVL